VDKTDLPSAHAMAADVRLSERLRIFDVDGSLARTSREVWAVIEPEIRAISEAYWQQWLRCFGDARIWAPAETQRMIDIG
jgi:hypothetical protein